MLEEGKKKTHTHCEARERDEDVNIRFVLICMEFMRFYKFVKCDDVCFSLFHVIFHGVCLATVTEVFFFFFWNSKCLFYENQNLWTRSKLCVMNYSKKKILHSKPIEGGGSHNNFAIYFSSVKSIILFYTYLDIFSNGIYQNPSLRLSIISISKMHIAHIFSYSIKSCDELHIVLNIF